MLAILWRQKCGAMWIRASAQTRALDISQVGTIDSSLDPIESTVVVLHDAHKPSTSHAFFTCV